MKVICVFFLGMLSSYAFAQHAQNRPLAQKVARMRDQCAQPVYLFRPFALSGTTASKREASKEIKDATLLTLSTDKTSELWQQRPQYAIMQIPVNGQQPEMELELVQQSPLVEGFTVITNTCNEKTVPYVPGVYYRGIIKGQPKSTVAISVFENEIIGIASKENGDNMVLGKIAASDSESKYIFYTDKNLPREYTFNCATTEPEGYRNELQEVAYATANKPTDVNRCVHIYIECDYALRMNRGSVTNTANFITAVFNNIATLYANEQITTKLSQVYVWDTPDNYNTTNSQMVLQQFRAARSIYDGDIALLVALGGMDLGGIADMNALCNRQKGHAYTNIDAYYANVPTYSWTVEAMTHEIGHNLGSPHTHSCSWPGGAIDNCYSPEGGCAPGPAPINGGTIMSYCHGTGYGTNLSNGFGILPGNLIRENVYNATCLTVCGMYCTPKSRQPVSSYINQIQLNTINKTSGNNNGYGNFTTTDNTLLFANGTYTATLTPGFTGTPFNCNWAVWIDYNKDGDFYDRGEAVASGNSSGTINLSFTVPSVISGSTRMRISVNSVFKPVPCDVSNFGEAEDYTIQFGPPTTALLQTVLKQQLYPNPANDAIHVYWISDGGGATVITLTDLTGRRLITEQYNSKAGDNEYLLLLNNLAAGNYLINVAGNGRRYHYKLTVVH